VIATILDSACGYAALSVADSETAVLAVEFKVNFVAPATGAIVARGRVAKAGRTLTVCNGEAHAREKGCDKLVASMLSTIMNVRGRGIAD
jgi:acyl-coenzyme A thioesterase PaaI-like protein